jgi:tripartite ATP-independent transporter DctP family solute receptor
MQFTKRALLATCAAVIALGVAPQAAAQKKIRIATISASNSPWHKAMNRFAETAAKESNNGLAVSVFTDGQLGDINQMYSSMQLGTLEMGYFGLGAVVLLKGAEAMNIAYVPYLFKNREAAVKVLNGPEFVKIYDDIANKTGVRIVAAFGLRSPRALQTTKGPITKPEDVKGLRLRIPNIDLLKATFEKLGAQVTPMGMLEIYTALSRGTVDGQDNGFDLSMPLKFNEVARHWSATDHAFELTGWFMSERTWKGLTDAEKKAIVKAAEAGGEIATSETRKLDEASIDTIRKGGGTYTVPDVAAFRTLLKDVHVPYEGKLWPAGMVDRIRKMQE